ncbi:hypothetical protein QBC47DRAFT_387895 [Echria macrotheca]|uniref:Uncharacterized protein n=1 Tax=Echria macrotheca TaxID=438768 RepID=A0AAJ0B7J5_9PEZI|nr:hypothetical protein QBC47DRAFT_387895 [Echria macrotheca]
MMATSPLSTPKRKHAELLRDHVPNLNTSSYFVFDSHIPPAKDGSASPRSRVAHRFRGLALVESGGGEGGGAGSRRSISPDPVKPRTTLSLTQDDVRGGTRKRVKLPGTELADGSAQDAEITWDEAARAAAALLPAAPRPAPPSPPRSLSRSPRQQSPRSVRFALGTAVVETGRKASSPVDGSSPRSRARAGTPPLAFKASAVETDDTFISDPLRASLTWHDDEITIYDPDDSDDDGTGINGIGFKPTPAVAYARAMKRGRQLAEYRKREERDARAKRSQRRRGSPVPGLVELKGTVERRRVRFMESATELISF